MKSTGHCLITSSNPFHSVILKTRGRLSTDFSYFLCKTLCAYQNSKLHSTSLVGAEHYPPCFSCGCPSPRVAGHGCFGVCLTLDLKFLAEAMCVIGANTNVPVSFKCRIELDDHDSYNELCKHFKLSLSQQEMRMKIQFFKDQSFDLYLFLYRRVGYNSILCPSLLQENHQNEAPLVSSYYISKQVFGDLATAWTFSRKICFCPLGFPKGKHQLLEDVFLGDVTRLEEFIKDPWPFKARQPATIQVKVPKLVVVPSPQAPIGDDGGGSCGDGEEVAASSSAQTKHVALQKKAAAASMVVVDIAKRFESGDVEGFMKDVGGEDQGLSNVKVMCRLCFSGENEGSERARKMMSCKSCRKKCHLSCLKAWGQHRDLFHWSSWTCPSCRLCEGCQETGDPNKFMYCKRCDAAYHCYCLQPPQKNVSSGPYLCPKHTVCHSCCSNVPGKGQSVRWYLGYTCCDACGRLFVKGNYCHVCLKVYRDSETTPMVCCDICQCWVHCQCDGISDDKYLQFQQNENLPYSCPACRGNSYEAIYLEDAVEELWRRRDVADRDLIASLRAGAGLPVEDEIFSISPFSDDEDSAPVVKNEHSRSLKFSLKGLVDKSLKKSKEYGKKSGKKKVLTGQNEGNPDAPSGGYSAGDIKNEELHAYGELDSFSSPVGSLTEGTCSFNQAGVKFIDEITGNAGKRTVRMKGSKPQRLDGDDVGIKTSMPKTSKEPKLVLHLGLRNKNIEGSPKSNASSCQKEQDLTTSHGAGAGVPDTRDNKLASVKHAEAGTASCDDLNDEENSTPSVSNSTRKDPKPLLWFKFKNPYHESQNAWASPGEEEKSMVKGQRSKRKRAPAIGGKSSIRSDDNSSQRYEDNTMDEFLDANWILQKLGQDPKGKRVEFHHPFDNTWHRGTVEEVFEGSSVVCVALDDGKKKNLELGKQGIRFVSQKQKH